MFSVKIIKRNARIPANRILFVILHQILPMRKIKKSYKTIEVVDLFCGIGGLSYGMKCKGLDIKGGFDIDGTCEYAYKFNCQANFFHKNVFDVTREDITKLYSNDCIRVLAGVHLVSHSLHTHLRTRQKTRVNMTCYMNLAD